MRNLKKVLALVLALVMAMSLVTIANAADFSDNAEIDYSEAVADAVDDTGSDHDINGFAVVDVSVIAEIGRVCDGDEAHSHNQSQHQRENLLEEIGRASCRERV